MAMKRVAEFVVDLKHNGLSNNVVRRNLKELDVA